MAFEKMAEKEGFEPSVRV